MDGICVDANARGKGVGSALLDALKDKARALACHSIRLDVIDQNQRARLLYERHGFVASTTTTIAPFDKVFGFKSATSMVLTL